MLRVGSRELMAFILVVFVFVSASLREPRFLDPGSLNSILLWMPLITVAAMGQLLVIVMGGIDISIGSILGFTGIAIGQLFRANPGLPVWQAFAGGAVIGLLLGMINGLLIVWGKLSPIVVTIGTLTAFRGAAFLLSKGEEIDSSMIPDGMTNLAKNGFEVGHVTFSYLLIIALSIGLLIATFLRMTQTGRDIFAYGSNPTAALLRGIPVKSITLLAYALCGATAGIAGVMYAARFGFVNPGSAGQSFELTVIAAVAIGGVKITGGYGTVGGVLLGCLLLSSINVALAVLGVAADWQLLTYGGLILFALIGDSVIRLARGEHEIA